MKRLLLLYCSVVMSVCLWGQTELLPFPTDTIQDTIVYRYYAPKSVGLYRISKIFDVPQDVIIRWNPQLAVRGPQLDEMLLIPSGMVVKKETEKKADKTAEPTKENIKEERVESIIPRDFKTREELQKGEKKLSIAKEENKIEYIEPTDSVLPVLPADSSVLRLAVLLPLNTQEAERTSDDDRFFDFYAGLLLAVNDYQKGGRRVEIHTYDVPKHDKGLNNVLTDPWLTQADALIGPAYSNQVKIMSGWALEHKKWILVPFTSNVDGIDNNPYILQFNPTSEVEFDKFEKQLLSDIDNNNPVHYVLLESAQGTTSYMKHLQEQVSRSSISHSTIQLHELMVDSADYAFRDSVENILVLHTDKYANASVLLPHIMQLAVRHQTTLFIPYSWLKMRLTMPLMYMTTFEINLAEQERLQAYENDFARFFGLYTVTSAYPHYDLLGYDLTSGLLYMLNDFRQKVAANPTTYGVYNGLQSDIYYTREQEEGGWMNKQIKIIRP